MKPLLLPLLLLTTSCIDGKLAPATSALIEQGAAAACTSLLPLASTYLPPGFASAYGAISAFACQGAEIGLAAALAPVTAPSSAITTNPGSSWGPGSARPLCAVRVKGGRMLGLAPCGAGVRGGYEMGAAR